MKVYIVTQGCYSDYRICAVFLDKKEAELYIATRWHDEIDGRMWSWDMYNEIEEYETQDGKIETNRQVGHFYWLGSNWGRDRYLEHQIMFEDDTRRQISHNGIWMPTPNKAKARKILRDREAEKKAHESGVC